MTERISYEIADPSFIIRQIQQMYSTPPSAFKEYVSNSVDAVNRLGNDPINLKIFVNKNSGTVVLRDNGVGMSHEKLRTLPQSIGASTNREVRSTRGEKGLGLHAYVSCGARTCQIYTRQVDSNNGFFNNLTMTNGSMDAELDEVHARDLPFGDFEHGTEVILNGINRDIIGRYFTPSHIKNMIADFYSPLIREGILEAEVGFIGTRQKRISVEPAEYRGEKVLDEIVQIEYTNSDRESDIGNVHLYLFINPNGKTEKVKHHNKGVKVLNSISSLDELDDLPWGSGRLLGEINEDFLTLNPQRDNLVRQGTRYQLFIDTLKEQEAYLNNQINVLKTREKRTRELEISDTILRNFDVIFRDFKEHNAAWIVGNPGDSVRPTVDDDNQIASPEKETGTRPGPQPKPGPGLGGEKAVKPSEDGVNRPTRKARRNISGNYNTHFVEFDIEKQTLRSELDPTYGSININSGHSDYKRVRDDESKFTRYTTYLLAQEIAYNEFMELCGRAHQDPTANFDSMRALADELYVMGLKISKTE
ncbi:hypothetical protein CL617_02310 [archaeon]|nr:hypothetical protein [archaeon]|tara:strand:- start:7595 stop:9193 length:1599 start_codon:yes stop_codon:yes gene_type:complete